MTFYAVGKVSLGSRVRSYVSKENVSLMFLEEC